jgi:hypothetical protein
VSDTAQVPEDGGTLYFYVASGTCADHGTGTLVKSFSVPSSSGVTTFTTSWDSTGYSPGSYVWLTYYGEASHCEPFTLKGSTVPEFPLGAVLTIALALPALLLLRTKLAKANPPRIS